MKTFFFVAALIGTGLITGTLTMFLLEPRVFGL